ncbi:MAG: OadG family transporter subunit [Motiliproteus sp.]|nr:OadG family transporter subunit [Motiliproteus sp.]MCW9052670.1 OadG family transporter subunit [Motiliproteus sp.]
MDSPSLISEGFTLMLAGMGFVFVFLTLLVYATTAMSKLVNKYIPEAQPAAAAPAPSAAPAPLAQDQAQLTAVIAAAIKQYRANHKK